jgi:hypothetical protein
MTAQEMLAVVERHYMAVRAAVAASQVAWSEHTDEGAHLFHGICKGYLIVVAQANVIGKGVVCDGALNCTTGKFQVIHLTPEMSLFCYSAATASQN